MNNKDVIYIDVDEEITAIIDKVRGSKSKIVALVLPKRATVFQSIVNMKLLKRTAGNDKKHVVLITSEAGLLPLAASVGMYVAKSLQSKPEVPVVPANMGGVGQDPAEDMAEEDFAAEPVAVNPKLDKSKPVGDLARSVPASPLAVRRGDDDTETLELDNTADTSEKPAAAAAALDKPLKKDKKLAIPDFNKFRLGLVLAAVALVLIVAGWYVGFVVMPKARVVVKTNSTAVNTNLDVTLTTAAEEVNAEGGIIPAVQEQIQKTSAQQVPATGQKDKGEKATGTIRFYNCSVQDLLFGNNVTIPAGTAVSTGGLTFITKKSVVVPPSHFKSDQSCRKDVPSENVDIVAQNPGDKYNIAAADYTVAGYANVSGKGANTAGGTSVIVKTLAQADIDNAKQKLSTQDGEVAKQELQAKLGTKNLFAVVGSFAPGAPEATVSAQVGDEVENVTVTQKISYTMFGAKEDDIKKVIAEAVGKQIDTKKQGIIDYGLAEAIFKPQNQQGTGALMAMEVTSIAGPDLKLEELKKQVAGKKANEAKTIIQANPGVTDVTVTYSPFWVSSIPKKTSKIALTVEKPQVKKDAPVQ